MVESFVAGLLGFAVVALVLALARSGGDDIERARVSDGAVGVPDVTNLGSATREVVVSGFVFVGPNRTILCSAREGDPPFCEGVAIDLVALDTSRLDLVVPDDAPAWSRDEVTVAGTYSLLTLTVQEILQ